MAELKSTKNSQGVVEMFFKKKQFFSLISIFIFCFIFFHFVPDLNPGVPNGINYQGRYKVNGVPVNTQTTFKFELYDAASGGSLLWSDTANITPENGLFNYVLNCSTVDFRTKDVWLQVTADGTTLGPRQRLQASAYSFYASSAGYAFSAGNLGGYDYSAFVTTGTEQTITGQKTFTSSMTITGAGGLEVSYGIKCGTLTLTGDTIYPSISTITISGNLRLGGNSTIYNINGSTKIWLGDSENIRIYSGQTGWFVFHDKNKNEVFKIDGVDNPGATYIYNNLSVHHPVNPWTQRFKVWGQGGVRIGQTNIDPEAGNLAVDGKILLYNLTNSSTHFIYNDNVVGAINISTNIYLSAGSSKIGNAHFFTSGFPNDTVDGVPWYGLGRRSGQVDPLLGQQPPVQLSGYYGLLFETTGYPLAITQWGRVGISTTAPLGKLHIKAPSDHIVLQDSDGPTDENIWDIKADNSKLEIITANDNWTSWGVGLKITRSGTSVTKTELIGDVGVGTDIPTHKLHVLGGILATSSITAQGGFYGDGSGLTNVVASNADTLDGLDSTDFVRKTNNLNETITGQKTFTSSVTITGAGGLGVSYGLTAGSVTVGTSGFVQTPSVRDTDGITRVTLATTGDNVTLTGTSKVSGQFIVTGSCTVQGAGGLGVSYGIRCGSITLTSPNIFSTVTGPADNIVLSSHTKVSGQLIVTGSCTISGSGLQVNNGIILTGNQDIKNYVNSSRVMIAGGIGWDQGGIFQIFGSGATGDAGPGGAQLQLWNTSDSKFEIYPYWDWTRRFRVWGMGGVRVGSTNIDPGANNLAVDGQVIILGSCTVQGSALEVGSGSGGGDALKIVNGGDLRIYSSGNTNSQIISYDPPNIYVSTHIYCEGSYGGPYAPVSVYPLGITRDTDNDASVVCSPPDATQPDWRNYTTATDWQWQVYRTFINAGDYSPSGKIQVKVIVLARSDYEQSLRFTIRDANTNTFGTWNSALGSAGASGTNGSWFEGPWSDFQFTDAPHEFRLSCYTTNSSYYYCVYKALILIRPKI